MIPGSITSNEFEIREALIGAQDAIVEALVRVPKKHRVAIFALVASILAPGETTETKARIAAEFLAPGVYETNPKIYG